MALDLNLKVNVSTVVSPLAAQERGFGIPLVIGDSNVIDGRERFRTYASLDDVAADFGTSAEEYKAASLFFGQTPRPATLMVGRWIRTATSALLKGASLSAVEAQLSNWTAITAGSFKITVDGGAEQTITGLNFSAATNLNGVASVITTALTGATAAWDGSRFLITSNTTGVTSSLSYLTPSGSGTDISALLKMTVSTGLPPLDGFDAEDVLDSLVELEDMSTAWYWFDTATSVDIPDSKKNELSNFCEGCSPVRAYVTTTTNTLSKDSVATNDLMSLLKPLRRRRTSVLYSSSNKYLSLSVLGRASTVNFNGSRTTITLDWKQAPGVAPEELRTSERNTLISKGYGLYAAYENGTAILENIVMGDGSFFDEVHGLDWQASRIQNNVWNVLYQSTTKLPQNELGVARIRAAIVQGIEQGRENGLIPESGIWTADGFGELKTGDFLPSGYYIYIQPFSLQTQADREARKCPSIQVGIKLAGAIHSVLDLQLIANR